MGLGGAARQQRQSTAYTRQPIHTQQSGIQQQPLTATPDNRQSAVQHTTNDTWQPTNNLPRQIHPTNLTNTPTTYNQNSRQVIISVTLLKNSRKTRKDNPPFPAPTHNPPLDSASTSRCLIVTHSGRELETDNTIIFISSQMRHRPRLQNSNSTTQTDKATPSKIVNRWPTTSID